MTLMLDKVQEFFFKAMIQGWASGAPAVSFPELPGFEGYTFNPPGQGLLSLRDCFTGAGEKFFGTTTIWREKNPIWMMHYQGWYKKGAEPLLRRALLEAYSKGIFLGGRGLDMIDPATNLDYHNISPGSRFTQFRGYEKIITRGCNSDIKGECFFQGRALIPMW